MRIVYPWAGHYIIEQENQAEIRMKILPTGAWNMLANDTHNVTHGLNYSQIINAQCFVTNDSLNILVSLEMPQTTAPGGRLRIKPTLVELYRDPLSWFNGGSFNDAVINRGYINLWYFQT